MNHNIYLIRHCTPLIDYSRCNYEEALLRLREYDLTTNIALDECLGVQQAVGYQELQKLIDAVKNENNLEVYSSTAPRSVLTAKAIFGLLHKIHYDNRFVEFSLDIIYIPFIKLSFRSWLLISRILWFMNFLKTSHCFAQERLRAYNTANFIYKKALEGPIVLVAHGLVNYFIKRYLKNYTLLDKQKNGCFSISLFKPLYSKP